MGCHTWFNNKLDSMPDKDYQKLKETSINNIKNNTIMHCNYDEWVTKVTSWRIDGETKKKFIRLDI
jgi:hypothetical protein